MFVKAIFVKGYQSLYKVGVSLGKFTVVYGESDVGKSAFYRAVRALITAEQGDSFVSKGEKKAGVLLILTSGYQIAWVKPKTKSCKYVLQTPDGQIQEWKRNRNAPMEVLDLLKLRQIGVDGDKFYPNLRGQFDSLFLLFESSSRRARVLGSLISNILLQGIRRANIERNRNEATVRALDELKEGYEKREKFDWKNFLAKMKGTLQVLQKTQKGVELYEKLEKLQSKRELLLAIQSITIKPLPDKFFMEIESLFKQREVLEGYKIEKKTLSSIVDLEELQEKAKGRIKEEIQKVKEKLKFDCPHCGKPISLLELKNV